MCHLLVNFVFSALLLTVAMTNYPGGDAIMKLHSLERGQTNVNVHIDVLTAQTGVSRFTELNPSWRLVFLISDISYLVSEC